MFASRAAGARDAVIIVSVDSLQVGVLLEHSDDRTFAVAVEEIGIGIRCTRPLIPHQRVLSD